MRSEKIVPNEVFDLLGSVQRPAETGLGDQVVLRRCRLLPEAERRLITLVFGSGISVRALAKAARINAGALCRKVERLRRSLHSPEAAALADCGAELPPEYRQVGLERFLRRRACGVIARQVNLSRSEVNRIVGFLQAWAKIRAA